MRIGIVTKWYSSGQAVVSRQLRSALDELGHDTFILARQGTGPRTQESSGDSVWEQPGITEVAESDVPLAAYEAWVQQNGIEVVLTDNLYQFEELTTLRERGVRTVGRFVWEHFSQEHVQPALAAFDVVYSLHRGEQQRYGEMGIESPYVTWGVHPELLSFAGPRANPAEPDAPAEDSPGSDVVQFYLPGSFLGKRKPLAETLEAFTNAGGGNLRLLVKGQVEKRTGMLETAAQRDPRITILLADQPTDEHFRTVAGADVCLSPTRWEGLGLPLFEALAFAQPVITNDNAPMNEVVRDGENGVLVASSADGTARSGIPAWTPDVGQMTAAIERLADRGERARLTEGAVRIRDGERAWSNTVAGYRELLERVA